MPLSATFPPPLLTSKGCALELCGVKGRRIFVGRVLHMSDCVIGSCGNEGRGAVLLLELVVVGRLQTQAY